jgi:tetratricopeptide (TPR) repeat protein
MKNRIHVLSQLLAFVLALSFAPSACLAGKPEEVNPCAGSVSEACGRFEPVGEKVAPILSALLAPYISTSVFSLGPLVDEKYDRGIALMYRLEFDEAEAQFNEIIKVDTSSPAGYFALAALSWWRYSQNFDVQADFKDLEDEFMKNASAAIKVCEGRLEKKEALDQTYFFMGSAYGLKGRWYAVQRRWFKAYTNGNKGRKLLGKAVKVNPELYDAYLGLGIFDYFADTLPGVLKIPALLFVRGDKARGISEVKQALEKGRFFSTEARLFLIEILTRHEKNFPAALEEVERLKAADRSNLFFRLGEVLTLIHAQSWEKALGECDNFLADYKKNPSPGITRQLSLIYLSAGDSYLALNKPREAAAWFTGGITETVYPNKGWITYCYLRRGQAMDMLGRREEAVADYKTVLERDNFWDSRKYAKSAVKKAPDFKEVHRQLLED